MMTANQTLMRAAHLRETFLYRKEYKCTQLKQLYNPTSSSRPSSP